MKIFQYFFFLTFPFYFFAQEKSKKEFDYNTKYERSDSTRTKKKPKVATIDLYRVITLERDTTYIDTSLTIQKEYSHNYLRKDIFGLLPFPNDGQTYNTLEYDVKTLSALPEFGFKAKHFNFLEANQIRYNSVATPVTEFYFKTTIRKGQSVDTFFTLNIAENLNMSIAYRGLRSEGEYINQLVSSGNFRFTTSYNSKNKRYYANAHYTQQDILNEENGGITNTDDFESEDPNFKNKQRFEVYLTDAKSFLKGKRVFLDHNFRINSAKRHNNLFVTHQFNYENKFFEYNQATVASNANGLFYNRFGDSYATSGINDQTHYNKMYNKLGVVFENSSLGKFHFFADDFRSNFYYNQILIFDTGIIPSTLIVNVNTLGAQYDYNKENWIGTLSYNASITNQSLSNLNAKLSYQVNDENVLSFQYQNTNKLPNYNYNLYQSSYVNYNWSNDFKNEKINSITAIGDTKWLKVIVQASNFRDHLYFENVSTVNEVQLVRPNQYGGSINLISAKLSKEIVFGKFALDNTILYQNVTQDQNILNVPDFVTRNTFYYSNYFFKKALFLQTGLVFNYFTKYAANEYNPVVGEFFIQNEKKIGNYPNFDFFVNAKIQRTRIYLKAEHFNADFTGNNYYASPTNPARDFTIRFGLIWNFFN